MTGSAPLTRGGLNVSNGENLGFSSARLTRITDWNNRLVDSGQLAGTSVLICRPGRGIWYQSAGHITAGTPQRMQEDTIFRIYSMTKPITSVA